MSSMPEDGWMAAMNGPTIGPPHEEDPVALGFPAGFWSGQDAGRPPAAAARSGSGSGSGSGWGSSVGGGAGALSHGLDVPACRDISSDLASDTDRIDRIAEDADRAVRRIVDVWDGADAEAFRLRWVRSRSRVEEASTSLRTMRRLLDQAVDEQEATSRS